MRRLTLLTARLILGAAVLLALVAAGGYLYLLRSLPDAAGTFEVAGLSGRVEIVRDADAIPHIFAADKLDALFGLGFVHAQDRLWQMEFQRRVGHGRLSEVLGSATIKQDRFLRTVGFGRAAKSAWDRLPDTAKAQVNAYVAGVNAFIDSHKGSRLPPEFSILRFTPEPWTGPDVLAWVKMMAWDLSANYSTELLRRDIAAQVGVTRMRELLPPYPPDGLNIVSPDNADVSPSTTTTTSRQPTIVSFNRAFESDRGARGFGSDSGARAPWTEAFNNALGSSSPALSDFLLGGGGAVEGLGSNNWVVDGTMTASGKPLLANDPHLGAQIPSVWYLAHITAGDFDVIGATLPGTPAVAIGRNRFIAWGETNMFADVQDLYREHLDATGKMVEFKGNWEPLEQMDETIRVKGGSDVHIGVRISRHGPLVSDAINANNADTAADSGVAPPSPLEPLAFRWTALDRDDSTIVAFFNLSEARNWTEFAAALKDFVVPSQNFVYADGDGHIGYYAPGRIPIRAAGDGLLPAEGWTGAMEWTGWIPFDALPHAYDPPAHFIVTANNRPEPPSYPYALGFDYHEPYRAQRITDLLKDRSGLTADDFAAIQADTLSLHARTLLPALLAHVRPQTEEAAEAVRRLREWNFNAAAGSREAAIFEAWFLRLAPSLVEDEIGPLVTRTYERRFSFITRFVANALEGRSTFCGPAAAPFSQPCDREVTAALEDGLASLRGQLGSDMTRWRWDEVHRAVFPHQALDGVPVLGWLFRRSIPNRGDWSTINVGAVAVDHPYEQRDVPGYRQIVDLSSLTGSRFLGSVGQSGHLLSPHYDDTLSDWHELNHRPMRMERADIERGAIGTLRLVPKAQLPVLLTRSPAPVER